MNFIIQGKEAESFHQGNSMEMSLLWVLCEWGEQPGQSWGG